MKSTAKLFAVATALTITASQVQAGAVMDDVKANDEVICLVNPNSPGFSVPDSQGVFQGFNTEFCRMTAAAILGDADKASIRGIGFSDSMKTIVAQKAHMASRSITRTGTRDANPGMSFVVTTFYDGQGFMVPKKLGVKNASELSGATVCAEEGSTTLLNIADWFTDNDMQYKVENINDKSARMQAFFSGKCDVLASDLTALASDRQLAKTPSDYVLLPNIISNEPLTLVARPDTAFETAIFWSFQVMLNAERLGVTSENIDQVVADLDNQPKAVQRLLGSDSAAGEMATALGLVDDWSYQIIKQVGNYGEVYDKHLGSQTALDITRDGTFNALVSNGGLLYPHPIR
ncbi:amino acid ABC transporter substrate-binding protein [Marinomonas ushuaiensis DSM 15871]|uniref:Amino acid ABC transporter substrate-binding protein n=1 Tax=Marinomonas ushuaiensis DSM 15871 TaxID=1122207 RepID=X7E8G9_9GAMM|nr:transporter substrate-binding domain-containing protein [Marinomonas ushuaiensis]ETX12262.1 amino acid ABC transporter substrate-binding protein [Marinomonas ushuaiensis DSM 15871]